MASLTQKMRVLGVLRPLNRMRCGMDTFSKQMIHKSSCLDSSLWSLKPSVQDEVYKQMMSNTDVRETIIILKNPGDPSFIQSFLHPEVKHVLCAYSSQSTLRQMEPKLKKLQTESCSLSFMCTDLSQSDAYKNMNFKDKTVKVLLKESGTNSSLLWYSHVYGFIEGEGIHSAGNLEWYCAIHNHQLKKLQNRRVCVNLLPPYYNYSQVMTLQETDFETENNRPKKSKGISSNGGDILLIKAEPNFNILQYLPTVEDRQKFSRFCTMKKRLSANKRLSPMLHEKFPGCLTSLSGHGFYINSVNKDISMQDYLQMYLILSKLPGFKDSELNAKLENHSNFSRVPFADTES